MLAGFSGCTAQTLHAYWRALPSRVVGVAPLHDTFSCPDFSLSRNKCKPGLTCSQFATTIGVRPNSCVTSRHFATGALLPNTQHQSLNIPSLRVLGARDIRNQSFLIGN